MKKSSVSFWDMILGSACVVITLILWGAYFGLAVSPDSEGDGPVTLLKFILLLLAVMSVVAGTRALLKAIWAEHKSRKLYIKKVEDIIDMTYTIVQSTPDEYIKDALLDVFRFAGMGRSEQQDPSPEEKGHSSPIADIPQGRPNDATSDTKPDS